MKLLQVHVTNYRNIFDSNEVEINQTTCLVGKNEAGKTAFLKALEGINSVNPNYIYDSTKDYPRMRFSDYDSDPDPSEKDSQIVETVWELEPEDIQVIESEFGSGTLINTQITISKQYDDETTFFNVPLNEQIVVQNLIKKADCKNSEDVSFSDVKSIKELIEQLTKLSAQTDIQKKLLENLNKYRDQSCTLKAIDLLSPRLPKFMYFSHYDRMSGEVSIFQLNKDKKEKKGASIGDTVFTDFLAYAGTSIEELASTQQFEKLKAKCEAAASKITREIFKYWTQNKNLKIKIEFSEGKSEDPAPFNSGLIARARVENTLHDVTVPFSERSAGFIWFFSFLVKFSQIKKNNQNVILLLDEPGLTLHGTAQKDLLRFFYEKIAPQHQIIWTTHSPFMVPANHLSDVRTVEDVVKTDEDGNQESIGTKIRSDVLVTDRQTNFPIFGAMGFEVAQTLIIGENTLLVEGPSDILYLQAASAALIKKQKKGLSPQWAICPSGGIDKILPFVRLFYGNKLNIVALTDYDRGQKRKLEDLYKAQLLEESRIILATQIAEQEEADIEDFFDPDFFINLVNLTYDLQDDHKLTVDKLNDANKNTCRIVKKIEAYFCLLPDSIPEFNHFTPSEYLLTHPELFDVDGLSVQNTLDKFEIAFDKISKFNHS